MKAATGQDVTAEELGGADVHARRSGVADYYATSDEHALALAREHRAQPAPACAPSRRGTSRSRSRPRSTRRDLYGLIPEDFRHQTDARELIARIVDGSRFHEFKQLYGETLVTGFARIEGYPGRDPREQRRPLRAVVAEGRALHRALLQAARSRSSSCRTSPASWSGTEYEAGGIARDGAKLVMAVANARVPKFTVVTGGSFGAGNYAMCGRAFEPRQLWMWPNARISVMGGEQAATVLSMVGDVDEDEIRAKYERRGQPVLLDRHASGTTGSSTRSTRAACSRSASPPR